MLSCVGATRYLGDEKREAQQDDKGDESVSSSFVKFHCCYIFFCLSGERGDACVLNCLSLVVDVFS